MHIRQEAAGSIRAPGNRGNGEGALWNVGNNGYSWSSSVSGTNGLYLNFNATNLNPSNTTNRANGLQVRCLQAFISILSPKSSTPFMFSVENMKGVPVIA